MNDAMPSVVPPVAPPMTESSRRDRQAFKQYRLSEKHGLGLGLFFSYKDLPPDVPIYVFQHTMKTGGTSLRALIYRNHDIYFKNVKIPKGEACMLMLETGNLRSVCAIFKKYLKVIHKKSTPTDPNYLNVSIAIGRVRTI